GKEVHPRPKGHCERPAIREKEDDESRDGVVPHVAAPDLPPIRGPFRRPEKKFETAAGPTGGGETGGLERPGRGVEARLLLELADAGVRTDRDDRRARDRQGNRGRRRGCGAERKSQWTREQYRKPRKDDRPEDDRPEEQDADSVLLRLPLVLERLGGETLGLAQPHDQ